MCVGSPTAGAWSSFQRRPDDEFETDRSLLRQIVLLFKLCWRHMTDTREQPTVVEPLDPFECREFHRFEMPPRASTADDLGLVEPDHRFGSQS